LGGPDTRGVRVAPATRGSFILAEGRPTAEANVSSCAFGTRTHPTSGPPRVRTTPVHSKVSRFPRVARTHEVSGSRQRPEARTIRLNGGPLSRSTPPLVPSTPGLILRPGHSAGESFTALLEWPGHTTSSGRAATRGWTTLPGWKRRLPSCA